MDGTELLAAHELVAVIVIYKLLNDPKSKFGRLFWKNWSVKTNTIKYLKLKTRCVDILK